MEIAVDATCWQNNRGYGRHARALLTELTRLDAENRYTFVMDSADNAGTVPSDVEIRQVRAQVPTTISASSDGHRSLGDMWRMSRTLSDPAFDLVLFPTAYSFVPVFGRAKKLVVIHDVIAETFPHLTLPSPTARFLWKAKVAVARWQADAIATVSEYSRRAIAERFRISPQRVFVVGEAPDPVFRLLDDPRPTPHLVSLGLNSGGRLVVYVGGFGPHKNLEVLVSAFARLAADEEFSDVRLVMVGENRKEVFHSQIAAIESQIDDLDLADRVVFTGYMRDEDLVVLLNLSAVLALPSLMEGFGLPAVEAAACGCPVIATTESPLPELLGEGGLYVNPRKPKELLSALTQLLGSEKRRSHMREAGLAAARRLTWEAAARQMMAIIKEVAAS